MYKNIFNKLKIKRNSAILITNLINVRYLSNFSGSNAQIIFSGNNLYFLTDFRYLEQAEKEIPEDFEIIIYSNFINEIKKILKKEKIKNIYFEDSIKYNELTLLKKKLKDYNFKPSKNLIENFRKIKTANEIKKIKKAISITENALKNISFYFDLKNFKITERDIALKLQNEMLKNGADDISFPLIVLSGSNSSLVHGKPDNNIIKDNILIDAGCKINGYCSDKTITIILKDNYELKKIYNIVKDAKNFAIDKIKEGVKVKDIDKIAREFINKKGYGRFFGHSLGHGVGLEVHELPLISPKSKDILENGNVITIEPGIYINGKFGIRLEDMVLVKEDGFEILTTQSENFLKCLQVL